MESKWIAFYISSHGFGHMTRCLAIIEELLEKTNDRVYIACGKFQNDFARTYLANYIDRVLFDQLQTDIGLINLPNSLKVDIQETEDQVEEFMKGWGSIVEKEVDFLQHFDVRYVVSDISPIGVLVGKQLNVETIGISNFTWVEQYEYLQIRPDIIQEFKKVYAHLDRFVAYELALPMPSLQVTKSSIGFVSRKMDETRIREIREQYGDSIFITCGKSANLDSIHVENYTGTIFTTSGITITGTAKVVQLPVEVLDTQNYIAASSLVVSKAGWGTISEAVTATTPLVLIEREDVLEDTHNIDQLKQKRLAISIQEKDLQTMDIQQIREEINQQTSAKSFLSYKNDTDSLLNHFKQ